jgi:hypothetical protein
MSAWSTGNTISLTARSVSTGAKFRILYPWPGHKGHRTTRCSDVQKHHQRCMYMWLLSIDVLTSTISRPKWNKVNTITQSRLSLKSLLI